MKVFISWSGPRSALLADALREWLQDVIQSIECFTSSEDIRAGQRWNNEINTQLNETDFGVLCVTQENTASQWLNFEAGALAKRINDDARVVPVTLGFAPAVLEEPLKQFNGVRADRAGILKLVSSIAESAKATLDVNKAFERWWPDLEARIDAIPDAEHEVEPPPAPEVPEMFSDIMSSLRGLTNEMRDANRYRDHPQSGRLSAEARGIAELMARDEGLRDAIAHGSRSAFEQARRHVRTEINHRESTMRGEEYVRQFLEKNGSVVIPPPGDDAFDEDVDSSGN